jgi:AbiV family abortive infection protein
MKLSTENLARSISACIENGNKLLCDAQLLLDVDRPSTALALSVLAQEEFSKGFLLQLILDDALPWLPAVRQSMAKHQCKHLLALVMEWLPLFGSERLADQSERRDERHRQKIAWLERRLERYRRRNFSPDPDDPEPDEDFLIPPDVADALNIYRHEQIERLRSGSPWTDAAWGDRKGRQDRYWRS